MTMLIRMIQSKTPNTLVRLLFQFACLISLQCAWMSTSVYAHEIPNDVKVQAFLKQDAQQLTLLIRAPMSAMKEVEFPLLNNLYLDVPKLRPSLKEAAELWFTDNLKLWQNKQALKLTGIQFARISLPSNRSFASFDEAQVHIRDSNWDLPNQLVWHQQYLDVEITYASQNEETPIEIDFGLQRLALQVAIDLKFQLLNANERAFELNAREGAVLLNPSAIQASWRFMQSGFHHILSGTDHLLFIACLLLTATHWLQLVGIITSFTIAHSVTLIAAAMGFAPSGLWFMPWVELAIAFSIFYMALENIWDPKINRRWMLCAIFGLFHGFGFSFALHETMQFAGSHFLLSLLSFNVGVEAGQLVVLAIGVPVVQMLLNKTCSKTGVVVLSAVIAHVAWHWMEERWVPAAKFLPTFFSP